MERRNTQQKKMVLDTIMRLRGHVTAGEVYDEVTKTAPHVSKGTVYRNLNILSEEGEIRRIEIPNGADYFDFNVTDHHHIVCTKCGKIDDVSLEDESVPFIRNTSGFKVLGYEMLFKGICSDCQKIIEGE